MIRELEFISQKLRDEQQRIMEDLAAGNAKDHGAYQHACGVIRGLLIANNVLAEMAERLEKDDE